MYLNYLIDFFSILNIQLTPFEVGFWKRLRLLGYILNFPFSFDATMFHLFEVISESWLFVPEIMLFEKLVVVLKFAIVASMDRLKVTLFWL